MSFNFIGAFTIPGQAEPKPFDPVEHRRQLWRKAYHKGKEKLLAEPPEVQEEKRERQRQYQRQWRANKKAEKDAILAEQRKNEPAKVLIEEEVVKREKKLTYQRKYHRDYRAKKKAEKEAAQSAAIEAVLDPIKLKSA